MSPAADVIGIALAFCSLLAAAYGVAVLSGRVPRPGISLAVLSTVVLTTVLLAVALVRVDAEVDRSPPDAGELDAPRLSRSLDALAEQIEDLTQVQVRAPASPASPRDGASAPPLIDFLWLLGYLGALLLIWHLFKGNPKLDKWRVRIGVATLIVAFIGTLAVTARQIIEVYGAWKAVDRDPPGGNDVVLLPLPQGPVELSTVVLDLQSSEEFTRLIVPFEHEGGCRPDPGDRGLQLLPGMAATLRWFGERLAACGDETEVVVKVRGYASSSPPAAGCGIVDADAVNLAFANARAGIVEQILSSTCPAAECAVTAVAWQSIEDMQQSVGFSDTDAGGFSSRRAVLTRRADVIVEDAAGCNVKELLTPPQNSEALD